MTKEQYEKQKEYGRIARRAGKSKESILTNKVTLREVDRARIDGWNEANTERLIKRGRR